MSENGRPIRSDYRYREDFVKDFDFFLGKNWGRNKFSNFDSYDFWKDMIELGTAVLEGNNTNIRFSAYFTGVKSNKLKDESISELQSGDHPKLPYLGSNGNKFFKVPEFKEFAAGIWFFTSGIYEKSKVQDFLRAILDKADVDVKKFEIIDVYDLFVKKGLSYASYIETKRCSPKRRCSKRRSSRRRSCNRRR